MDIVFSARNNEIIRVLPVVPPDIPVVSSSNHEEFMTVHFGVLKLIGEPGLKEISIDSFFPSRDNDFMKPYSVADPMNYIEFFETFNNLKEPIRCVMTLKNGTVFQNLPVVIDSFIPRVRKNGDVGYQLKVSEYKFVGV